MAFKPIDPKRDEFRRYLERAGVVEALTKVFVRLVKERPENPMEYLQHNLGDSLQQADNVAYLQNELDEAHTEIDRLRNIIQNKHPEALEELRQELVTPAEQKGLDGDHTNGNREPEGEIEIAGAINKEDLIITPPAAIAAIASIDTTKSEFTHNEEALEEAVNNCHISDANPSAAIQTVDNNV